MNIALNKKILETTSWTNSQLLTDGNTTSYNGSSGFGYTFFPNYCTLDLEDVCDLKFIRFLLYDKDSRNYKYRLLTSVDLNSWAVHFDSGLHSFRSWQNFEFSEPIKVRYIRIHALWNSANSQFHIVQIEAHPDSVNIPSSEEINIIQLASEGYYSEVSDGYPISFKMANIANTIRDIPLKFSGLDKEYFSNIASELETRIYDVGKIEKGMDAIRRQIIDPVNLELSRSNKIGNISVILGITGGIIGIISLVFSLFFSC